ncbi:phosphatase, partial [Vibrio sp. 1974]|nr:phosphatase [Vibrio sp. 1974]
YFSTGSDAHFCEEISKLDLAIELLEKHGVEKDKILTTSTRRFLKFLLLRGKPRIPEFDAFY